MHSPRARSRGPCAKSPPCRDGAHACAPSHILGSVVAAARPHDSRRHPQPVKAHALVVDYLVWVLWGRGRAVGGSGDVVAEDSLLKVRVKGEGEGEGEG